MQLFKFSCHCSTVIGLDEDKMMIWKIAPVVLFMTMYNYCICIQNERLALF